MKRTLSSLLHLHPARFCLNHLPLLALCHHTSYTLASPLTTLSKLCISVEFFHLTGKPFLRAELKCLFSKRRAVIPSPIQIRFSIVLSHIRSLGIYYDKFTRIVIWLMSVFPANYLFIKHKDRGRLLLLLFLTTVLQASIPGTSTLYVLWILCNQSIN